MKVEYINPFLTACTDVISQMCGVNINRGKPTLKHGAYSIENMGVSIGITGEVKGEVFYAMSQETAMHIASLMMCGMEVHEVDDLCRSAICELGNIITGQASVGFSEMGLDIDITPPKVIVGQEVQIYIPETVTLCVPMQLGERYIIDVNVSLR